MQMDIKDGFVLLCVSFSISENVYFCVIYIFVSAAFDSLAPQQHKYFTWYVNVSLQSVLNLRRLKKGELRNNGKAQCDQCSPIHERMNPF